MTNLEIVLIILISVMWLVSGFKCILSFKKFNKKMIREDTGLFISICFIFLLGGWFWWLVAKE